MYMKLNYPQIVPSSALPQFVLSHMPPFVSGIIMAALLVTVVGTGAGLALGISTVITKDIYKNYIRKNQDESKLLNISRLAIVVVLAAAVIFTAGNLKSYILEWSFMSMGLRGASVFVPLCTVFFLKGCISKEFVLAGVLLSLSLIHIYQSPIGRTPRSNPATYTGVFDYIRDVYSMTLEAKERGYKKGRFSFNVKGGRCEACRGDGILKIEMHFLSDVYVPCDVCKGKRYNRETLEVKYKGKNIADVLDMTVDEALEFFENIPKIQNKIKTLQDVGLSLIHI